jgi:hypothetical protein
MPYNQHDDLILERLINRIARPVQGVIFFPDSHLTLRRTQGTHDRGGRET